MLRDRFSRKVPPWCMSLGERREDDMSSEKTYNVRGMTCGHCERALREEVERVPGVRAAAADHRSGSLLVRGDEFEDGAVGEAVETAGFELVR